MDYPVAPVLTLPLINYEVNSYRFGEDCSYGNVRWGIHLGEDVNRHAWAPVMAIGRGRVVYSALHPGRAEHGNWGNIVIIGHEHVQSGKPFFSLYAHLGLRLVKVDDEVALGSIIGSVGPPNTPENGWWDDSHLHFAIYVGPWAGKVLPGYWREDQTLTRLEYWLPPSEFVLAYPQHTEVDKEGTDS